MNAQTRQKKIALVLPVRGGYSVENFNTEERLADEAGEDLTFKTPAAANEFVIRVAPEFTHIMDENGNIKVIELDPDTLPMGHLGVRMWRKRRRLTQVKFAQILGVAESTIQRWEAGDVDVPTWLDLAMKGIECRELHGGGKK